MTLQHRGAVPPQFILQSSDDLRVIVSGVVHAIAGEEIEVFAAFRREQLHTLAARISNIHLEQFEEPDPLRIHAGFVAGTGRKCDCRLSHGSIVYNWGVKRWMRP